MFKFLRKSKPAAAAAADTSGAKAAPLLLEGPKTENGTADPSIIDLAAVSEGATASESAAPETAAPHETRWRLPAYAPIAASVAFAIVIGAIAGAAATGALMRDTADPTAGMAMADQTRALQDTVAQLSTELAALKAGLATAQKTASTQLGKLAERVDRTEKAQAEPTAKIAKLQETVDRLDRRPQQAAANDITNSVPPPKEESKPQVVEGWRLRDFYDGRAVVESRNGTLFRVGPGSNVPGLGKVEAIKRENGRVVVVTSNGIVAASLEQRRPMYFNPYRW